MPLGGMPPCHLAIHASKSLLGMPHFLFHLLDNGHDAGKMLHNVSQNAASPSFVSDLASVSE